MNPHRAHSPVRSHTHRITRVVRGVLVPVLLAAGLAAVPTTAGAVPGFQDLLAPFTCGTEWAGGTRSGHGYNNWNLDLNRVERTYDQPDYDLGQPLLAQADGVVSWLGIHSSAGTYLDIDYGDYTVRYVHLVHDSIPTHLATVGATVELGELIGLLGDTGNATHAHLHLEYFDSRDYVDAAGWQIPDELQVQIAMAGEPIDPGEPFVSTNCGGIPPPHDPTILDHVEALSGVAESAARDHLVQQLQPAAEALDGTTDEAAYLDVTTDGTNVFARIPGTDLASEAIMVSTPYTSTEDCGTGPDPAPCPGATDHAVGSAVALELASRLAGTDPPPRRTIVFAFWDATDGDGTAAETWLVANSPGLADQIVTTVDIGRGGANPTLSTRSFATASLLGSGDSTLDTALANSQPTIPTTRLWRFAGPDLASAFARRIVNHGVPTVSFHDPAGPCAASPEDTSGIVDGTKAAGLFATIDSLIAALAAADTPVTAADPDSSESFAHDVPILLDLLDVVGVVGAVRDGLAGLATEPPAMPTPDDHLVYDAALADLRAVLEVGECRGHLAPDPFDDVPTTSYATADVAVLYDLGVTTGTDETTYTPGEQVDREQMAAFLARVWRLIHPDAAPSVDNPFDDVDPSSFAYDDIALIAELGITTGTSLTTYAPHEPITREQMAAFLARLWLLLDPAAEPGAHPFVDVDLRGYASPHIALIYGLGITTGTSATTYGPQEPVTREQMAAFLARFIRATA